MKLVVSFADPAQGHIGGIYQAGNWVYIGKSAPGLYYELPNGKLTHNRNLQGPKGFGGSPTKESQTSYTLRLKKDLASGKIKKVVLPSKYKYVFPLIEGVREVIEEFRLPYPKKVDNAPEM